MHHAPVTPSMEDENRQPMTEKLRVKPWLRDTPQPILFKNANLVDPEEGRIIPNSFVLVKNGFVDRVGTKDSLAMVLSHLALNDKRDNVMVVDLEGKLYLCPGLVDCHVHVTAVPGVKTMPEVMNMPVNLVSLRSTYVLRDMLSRGFTTVRDAGGASATLAEAIEEWLVPGPRLIQCGKALSQTGGHGDTRPIDSTPSCCGGAHDQPGLGRICDGVPQVLAAVRDEIRRGANFIKVMCGGGVASHSDPLLSLQFTSEELRAITSTCAQIFGPTTYRVSAHAYSVPAIMHAITNGVNAIEHGNFIDQPTAKLMASKGVFLTPTLSCYGIMVRPPFEDFLPEESKRKNEEVMKAGLDAIRIAEEAGVTVCYGTDLLVSMHALQTEEFAVRSRVLPSASILKHATTNAARLLQLEGKIGCIAPGAFGDLIILNANPLEDVTVLDKPDKHLLAVMKGGHVFRSRLEILPVDVTY